MMMCDITSCVALVRLQDYLLSHMYANAARDDLWSKLTQVSSTCETGRVRAAPPPTAVVYPTQKGHVST